MPKIEITFSIPEDPTRGTTTVIIEGPNPDRVAKAAAGSIHHFTSAEGCHAVDLF